MIVVIFGIGMVIFGLFMTIKPLKFSAGITSFSEKPWFHLFEIFSRLVLGVLFLLIADQTAYPNTIKIIGGVLCFVSLFLVIIGAKKHRAFAQRTSTIGKHFRILGVFAILCGIGVIYLGVS